MIKFKELFDSVSKDCSTGAGIVPGGPWNGYKIIRTNHLDEPRKEAGVQRDHGVTCDFFDEIAKALFRKRPLGLRDGDYAIFWRNSSGVQNAMIDINTKRKTITFVTMIQHSKSNATKYKLRSGSSKLNLGIVKEPK